MTCRLTVVTRRRSLRCQHRRTQRSQVPMLWVDRVRRKCVCSGGCLATIVQPKPEAPHSPCPTEISTIGTERGTLWLRRRGSSTRMRFLSSATTLLLRRRHSCLLARLSSRFRRPLSADPFTTGSSFRILKSTSRDYSEPQANLDRTRQCPSQEANIDILKIRLGLTGYRLRTRG